MRNGSVARGWPGVPTIPPTTTYLCLGITDLSAQHLFFIPALSSVDIWNPVTLPEFASANQQDFFDKRNLQFLPSGKLT